MRPISLEWRIRPESRLRLAGSLLAFTLVLASPPNALGQQSDACASDVPSSSVELPAGDQIETLARLVDRRLSHMEGVAAYKWLEGLPIEDLERERLVMDNTLQSAARHGLDPVSVRPLFEQLIELAKAIQVRWFEQWRRTSFEVRQIPDLPGQVRPELLVLGEKILAAVSDLAPWRLSRSCLEELGPVFIGGVTTETLSAEEKSRLFRSILTIRALEPDPGALAPLDER